MASHAAYKAASDGVTCVVKPNNTSAPQKTGSAAVNLKEVKVQLQIAERESRKTACCKSDGMRFAGADTTVKLRQDMTYLITVTTTPAVAISVDQAEIKQRQAECQEPSFFWCCTPKSGEYQDISIMEWSDPVKVPISERNAASNSAKAVYELAWDCNMELTRRGVRGELSVDIVIQDFGCVTLPILAKVYQHEDTSATHGMPLHSITYNFGRSGLTGEVRMYSVQYLK